MWDYSDTDPFPYGEETTYRIGMGLLAECERVEDWGCGTCWAKHYREGSYTGIDWAPGFADVVADLRTYISDVDGIFMRAVLEHNTDWADILDNALVSAPHLVLVLFTPMVSSTRTIYADDDHIDIAFAAKDLEAHFGDREYSSEDYQTATQYGVERIYDIEKL